MEQSEQPSPLRREQRAIPSDSRQEDEDTPAGGYRDHGAVRHFLDHHHVHWRLCEKGHRSCH